MLSHELRNPLAPIGNALQIMHMSAAPEAHRTARDMIERQLRQLVHLVDDLLDVSRISQGKVELRRERIELAAVISIAFNYCFVVLWITEYGERAGMKRFLTDYDGNDSATVVVAEQTTVVVEQKP